MCLSDQLWTVVLRKVNDTFFRCNPGPAQVNGQPIRSMGACPAVKLDSRCFCLPTFSFPSPSGKQRWNWELNETPDVSRTARTCCRGCESDFVRACVRRSVCPTPSSPTGTPVLRRPSHEAPCPALEATAPRSPAAGGGGGGAVCGWRSRGVQAGGSGCGGGLRLPFRPFGTFLRRRNFCFPPVSVRVALMIHRRSSCSGLG